MPFILLVVRNLTRRRFRTALTLVAFATAVAAVVALLGVAKGFTESFAEIYESHAVDVVVSRQGSADRLSSAVDEAFIPRIGAVKGVARADGVLLETLSLEDARIYGIPTMGIAPESWLMENFEIQGEADASPGDRSLMLGMHLAERVGVTHGDTVQLFEEPYVVRAIFKSQSVWENGSMILDLDQLQSLTDRTGQVTYINVVLDTSLKSDAVARTLQDIQSLDSRLHALTTQDFVQTDTRMRIATAMAWMTSMIALTIGAIGTLNTMMTSVMERTREIGILRAIGWSRRRVVSMILMEAGLLAVVAGIAGCGMAITLTGLLSQAEAARGILTPVISPQVLVQGLCLALAIGLLGALIPAWRAARMLPVDAFRDT